MYNKNILGQNLFASLLNIKSNRSDDQFGKMTKLQSIKLLGSKQIDIGKFVKYL